MIEVEVFGAGLAGEASAVAQAAELCNAAAATLGVSEGHVAIEFVDAPRIAALNAAHRGRDAPTDVLSFPIDGVEPLPAGSSGVARELGDIVICPEHTADLREAIVHGMLHLLGMDHERDSGEMLALEHELLGGAHSPAGRARGR